MSKLRKRTLNKNNKKITRNVKTKKRERSVKTKKRQGSVKTKRRQRNVKTKRRQRSVKINKKGGNKREIYLHFTCEHNRLPISKSGLIPNAPPLLDEGEDDEFRPIALLKGYVSDNGNVEFEADDSTVLNILCLIASDCCEVNDEPQSLILFFFEKNKEDEIVKHPRMTSEYQAYNKISPLRLTEVNKRNWPNILARAVRNCGYNEICNAIYNR